MVLLELKWQLDWYTPKAVISHAPLHMQDAHDRLAKLLSPLVASQRAQYMR